MISSLQTADYQYFRLITGRHWKSILVMIYKSLAGYKMQKIVLMWPSALVEKSPQCCPAPYSKNRPNVTQRPGRKTGGRAISGRLATSGRFSILPKKSPGQKKNTRPDQEKSRPVRPGPAKIFSLPIPALYMFLKEKVWNLSVSDLFLSICFWICMIVLAN